MLVMILLVVVVVSSLGGLWVVGTKKLVNQNATLVDTQNTPVKYSVLSQRYTGKRTTIKQISYPTDNGIFSENENEHEAAKQDWLANLDDTYNLLDDDTDNENATNWSYIPANLDKAFKTADQINRETAHNTMQEHFKKCSDNREGSAIVPTSRKYSNVSLAFLAKNKQWKARTKHLVILAQLLKAKETKQSIYISTYNHASVYAIQVDHAGTYKAYSSEGWHTVSLAKVFSVIQGAGELFATNKHGSYTI